MGPRQFNLADLFEIVVDTVPDRLALVAGAVRLSYGQLDDRSNRFAHDLARQGISLGAHVGILAYNRAEWVEAMVGCYKARAVPINLNYRYVVPELRYVIENADLEVLVFERALSPLVAGSLEGLELQTPLRLMVVEDGSGADPGPAGGPFARLPAGRATECPTDGSILMVGPAADRAGPLP